MNEFELIHRLLPGLATNAAVVVGAGDDCAVLDLGMPGHWLLFKTDAVVENVHFAPSAEPTQVGHKALARCLSDIAAMAGTPTAALVTLALPATYQMQWVEAVYAGLNALAQRHGLAVAGGETTLSPAGIMISVAVLGTVPVGKTPLRSGGKAGDALFVTGDLGGSLAGRHLQFDPRLVEARWLAQHWSIHCMIDLSDGLASDVRHLLNASRVGAELHASAIPISRAARQHARSTIGAKSPLLAALTDGEDFELLFSVPSAQAVPLLDEWKQHFPGVRLSCVGKLTSEPGVRLRDKDGVRPLLEHGYVHFQKP